MDVGGLGRRRHISLATKPKLDGRVGDKARVVECLDVRQVKSGGQRVFRMRSPASR
jgi:hypothetical protein